MNAVGQHPGGATRRAAPSFVITESPSTIGTLFTSPAFLAGLSFGAGAQHPNSLKLEQRGVNRHEPNKISAEKRQRKFQLLREIDRDTICRKLADAGRLELTRGMGDCHSEQTFKVCTGCSRARVFWNRCETKFCPICAPRLARERRDKVEWWATQIRTPKHVVLTCRNTATITKQQVLAYKANLVALRRQKWCANWKGGFYSIETTNESRGWHIHFHLLVDSRFIDEQRLAIEWGKLNGQDFAIVKVLPVNDGSYLKEVLKYNVKGSQMAKWSGSDIAAFMDAFHHVKTFDTFGSLRECRAAWKKWKDEQKVPEETCECGSCTFRTMDANTFAADEIRRERAATPRPPPLGRIVSHHLQHPALPI